MASIWSKFAKLSAGERIAVITGGFVVIAALIQIMPALVDTFFQPSLPDDNDLKVPNLEFCYAEIIPESTDSIYDGEGNHASAPYIDLTLLNKGMGVGVINRLDLEVINASLNISPVLEYFASVNKTNNLFSVNVYNVGWGSAKRLEYNASLNFGQNTSLLGFSSRYLKWKGDVNPGEDTHLNFRYNPQTDYYLSLYGYNPDDLVCAGNISEQIRYEDILNNRFEKNNKIAAYIYKINQSIKGFTISNNVGNIQLAIKIPAIQILNVDSMDPERRCPYNISFYINHQISENAVDRIIIGLSSAKSGQFLSKIKVYYNAEKPVISGILDLNLIKRNEVNERNPRSRTWATETR